MQVDRMALQLRPRTMFEAADLGARLVQAHAASLWRCWLPVWAAVVLLALASVEVATWLPGVLVFALKPWLDRTLLFVFARAAFGEASRFDDLVAAAPGTWLGGLWRSLVVARLSPWRSYTQPAWQLEGQRGRPLRQRAKLLLGSHRGAAAAMQFAFAQAEFALTVGAMFAIVGLLPGVDFGTGLQWFLDSEHIAPSLAMGGLYALVVLLLEPFFVAAGFAMYLNRRVELEAWDIEQAFRHAFAR